MLVTMDREGVQYTAGLALTGMAAGLMLIVDGPLHRPIILFIVGIALLATVR